MASMRYLLPLPFASVAFCHAKSDYPIRHMEGDACWASITTAQFGPAGERPPF